MSKVNYRKLLEVPVGRLKLVRCPDGTVLVFWLPVNHDDALPTLPPFVEDMRQAALVWAPGRLAGTDDPGMRLLTPLAPGEYQAAYGGRALAWMDYEEEVPGLVYEPEVAQRLNY